MGSLWPGKNFEDRGKILNQAGVRWVARSIAWSESDKLKIKDADFRNAYFKDTDFKGADFKDTARDDWPALARDDLGVEWLRDGPGVYDPCRNGPGWRLGPGVAQDDLYDGPETVSATLTQVAQGRFVPSREMGQGWCL
ncbi:hypothetical protein JTB14_025289 [Gonioctena quinquepunctata]|nr:hypothetical protein JTB14_025289 [Gonioctena quinquepunctata]